MSDPSDQSDMSDPSDLSDLSDSPPLKNNPYEEEKEPTTPTEYRDYWHRG